MTDDGDLRSESVFRDRWRERRSASSPFGELVKQPRWITAGVLALGLLIAAGLTAGFTITIAQTAALPAAVQSTSVTAVRSGDSAPDPGTVAQFRDASGVTINATVSEVTATEVLAQLEHPSSSPAGVLVVPSGRQRLIDVLLSRLL
ncbi:hypothetical protein [Smaragdicoccus niigatensis]|uniref:hypothetical protein n=1 Tax=Smaragdicoccus niigatensis TaxID=359359 RepID=UPI00035C4152|nr:hypothetical protein [Smaragdicoccus niigatensis]